MKDIAYSELKKNERAYEIMTLRDQNGNTFFDMAKEFGVSFLRVRQIYNKQSLRRSMDYLSTDKVINKAIFIKE